MAATVVAVAAFTGCGDSGDATDGETTASPIRNTAAAGSTGSVYVAIDVAEWELRQALNPRPDDPLAGVEPSLDWYAEYERNPSANESQLVRVSGHHLPMAQLEDELASVDLEPVAAGAWSAVAGRSVDPAGPAVVLFEVEAGLTVMTLSYELGLDELIDWTTLLEPITEAEWIARGGEVAT